MSTVTSSVNFSFGCSYPICRVLLFILTWFKSFFVCLFWFLLKKEEEISSRKMSSKLRRTPLFGYDGNLGIPIIPPKNSSNNKASSSTTSHSSSTGSKFGYEYNKSKVCQNIFFFIYFLGSVAVKCKKTSTFWNVRIFCLKMPSSSRKPTKKFFYLKNSYTSKCKIRNVRVQRHNHNHRSTNCWFEWRLRLMKWTG